MRPGVPVRDQRLGQDVGFEVAKLVVLHVRSPETYEV
jgi:hypothetical protein